jgi:hypothetical protein
MAKQHYILHERHKDIESSNKIFEEFVNLKENHKEENQMTEECMQQQQQPQPQQIVYSPRQRSISKNINPINKIRSYDTPEKQQISMSINMNPSNKIRRYDTPEEYLTPWKSSNFRSISPEYNDSFEEIYRENNTRKKSKHVHAEWGTAHPFFHSESERITWSDEEKRYLCKWFDYNLKAQPNTKNITSKCLEAIKRDPNALEIFHKRHIVDSGRLRVGYDHYLRQKSKRHKSNLRREKKENCYAAIKKDLT